MKITAKGRVTIPKHIRETLGLFPGTKLALEVNGEVLLLRRARQNEPRAHPLVAHMRGRADTGLTTDEIVALTRG